MVCWPRWRRLWPLGLTTLVLLGSVALFFVFARYRHPALPPLLLFAAAGVTGLGPAWRQSRRRVAAALAAGMVAAVLANAPFDFGQRRNGAMAKNNLGTALAAESRWPEAAAAYRDALAIDPELLEGHLNLGSTLLAMGQNDAAIEHLEVAYRRSTNDADVAHQLGAALAQRGDLARAEPVLRQALALRPASVPAVLDLSWVLRGRNELDRALQVVRQGLQLNPGEASLALRLAALLLQRPERSAEDLKQAIRLGLAGCAATGYRNRDALRITHAALVAADRGERARELAQQALDIAISNGDRASAEELRQVLESF